MSLSPDLKQKADNEEEVDINELLSNILKNYPSDETIVFQFQNTVSVKDLFEILLQFFTNICKLYYGDENDRVNLQILTNDDLNFIRKYFKMIGMDFNVETFNNNTIDNLEKQFMYNNQYNKIEITMQTPIEHLYFMLQCQNILYKISFTYL
jgi:hypothetical protein